MGQTNSTDQQQANSITCWSNEHFGDVTVPEICEYSIDNQCRFEKTGCKRLHAKGLYHWQIEYNGKWINLSSLQSKELEESFQDPSENECSVTPVDIDMLDPSKIDLFKILVGEIEKWNANFISMRIKHKSKSLSYKMRRLSTHSAAISKSSKATVFEWYFLDNTNAWISYGNKDSSGSEQLISNAVSCDIEKHFINNRKSPFKFNNSNFEYELDFSKMTQRNLTTSTEREVRRRPQKRKIEHHGIQVKNDENCLPAHWDPLHKSDSLICVPLTPEQKEYTELQKRLVAEVANATVISIKRIQNPFLWRALKNKMDELILKYGSEHKLNIQQLFHGTRSDIVYKICVENFDWRLHGTSTGQLYGRGTYFSNSSAYSHSYSPPCGFSGRRHMMVAKVLVGYTKKGDPTMTRPPLNSTTGMLYDTTVDDEINPKIFVKYEKQEYYPEYIIEYTTAQSSCNIQ